MSEPQSLEEYRRNLDGSAIFTYIIVTIAVPCKIWCKVKAGGRRNVGIDDIPSVAALLLANGMFWICILGLRQSLGKGASAAVSLREQGDFLKYLFATSLIYPLTIAFIKFTILAFYWRLFSVIARNPLIILTCLVFTWLITLFFLALFSCRPIQAQFDLSITAAHCIGQKGIYTGGSLVNTVTDFVLVLLPIRYVVALNASLAQRIALGCLFALGVFTSVVSMIRLPIALAIPSSDSSNTYHLRNLTLWSIVEINVGLTCACLPSMRPMFVLLSPHSTSKAPRRQNTQSPNDTQHSRSRNVKRFHPRDPATTMFSSVLRSNAVDSRENIILEDQYINTDGTNNMPVIDNPLDDDSRTGNRCG